MGLIPACAGTTMLCGFLLLEDKAHPRLRGDYCDDSFFMVVFIGSSPPARGLHCVHDFIHVFRRLIPACAGTTNSYLSSLTLDRAHPRLRGDYRRCPTTFCAL